MLLPKYGSGNTPAATWAASTVLGTLVFNHASSLKPGSVIASPPACRLHADCNRQPSCRWITDSAGRLTAAKIKSKRENADLFLMGISTFWSKTGTEHQHELETCDEKVAWHLLKRLIQGECSSNPLLLLNGSFSLSHPRSPPRRIG